MSDFRVTFDMHGVNEALGKVKLHEIHLIKEFKKEIKNSARAVKRKAVQTMIVGTKAYKRKGKGWTKPGQTKKSIALKTLEHGYVVTVRPAKKKDWFSMKNGWKRHWIEYGKGHGRGRSKFIDTLGRRIAYIPPRPIMTNAEKSQKNKFESRMKKLANMGLRV